MPLPIHEAFITFELNDDGQQKAKDITEAFDLFLYQLQRLVPMGRELSLVTTKLEEACFFAKKGMARRNCVNPVPAGTSTQPFVQPAGASSPART